MGPRAVGLNHLNYWIINSLHVEIEMIENIQNAQNIFYLLKMVENEECARAVEHESAGLLAGWGNFYAV